MLVRTTHPVSPPARQIPDRHQTRLRRPTTPSLHQMAGEANASSALATTMPPSRAPQNVSSSSSSPVVFTVRACVEVLSSLDPGTSGNVSQWVELRDVWYVTVHVGVRCWESEGGRRIASVVGRLPASVRRCRLGSSFSCRRASGGMMETPAVRRGEGIGRRAGNQPLDVTVHLSTFPPRFEVVEARRSPQQRGRQRHLTRLTSPHLTYVPRPSRFNDGSKKAQPGVVRCCSLDCRLSFCPSPPRAGDARRLARGEGGA